jgi:3-dehydroquinate synthase class II
MPRISIASAAFAIIFSYGAVSAFAQSPAEKPKYPAEIAAASMLLVQKQETCRRQARQQKLGFMQRRHFVRECLKKRP